MAAYLRPRHLLHNLRRLHPKSELQIRRLRFTNPRQAMASVIPLVPRLLLRPFHLLRAPIFFRVYCGNYRILLSFFCGALSVPLFEGEVGIGVGGVVGVGGSGECAACVGVSGGGWVGGGGVVSVPGACCESFYVGCWGYYYANYEEFARSSRQHLPKLSTPPNLRHTNLSHPQVQHGTRKVPRLLVFRRF